MTRWNPQIELVRLLDALGREILAASGEEVRHANVEGARAIRASADEVRRVIEAVIGDAGEPGEREAGLLPAALLRELRARPH